MAKNTTAMNEANIRLNLTRTAAAEPTPPTMQLSIRSRLLLLLLSVLLPGLLGVSWLIASTVDTERDKNTRLLRDAARALAITVDDELSRRAMLARVLALSHGLDEPNGVAAADLDDFDAQVHAALSPQPAAGWVELWGAHGVVYDSRQTADLGTQLPPPRGPPMNLSDVATLQAMAGAATTPAGPSVAMAALVEPVRSAGRTLLNVAVMLPGSELQRLVDSLPVARGWTAAVMDDQGAVLALHPAADPASTIRFGRRNLTGEQAAFDAMSADGTATTGWLHRSRFGWSAAVATPNAGLTGDWPVAASRIALASLVVLLLAAVGSLWLARRISQPLQALTEAARRLHHGLPVQPHRTGIIECDEVYSALGRASQAIRHSHDELQQQVGAAVASTRLAEQVRAHGQRVEALGRLTGGVAHDFNNLLGIISNSTHLMQRHAAAAELQMPLRATQQAVESGSRLTQHLLRFAGRRPTRPQRVHLAHWLPEVRDLIASVLGSRIKVHARIDGDTPPVTVDPGELELALLNLALNARDAMPVGGELRLLARPADAADRDGRLGPALDGEVLITIADDGSGIEEDQLERLFEPFYTTKPVGKGSGLGLSQVLGFCKQAGGTAWADSTMGIGTTVSMLLPAAAPVNGDESAGADSQAARQDRATPCLVMAGTRVLLVEDNPALADTTEALLRSHGAQVRRAADAAGAMRLVDCEPGFDVVLSDVVMPGGIDGLG
ncbi:MAG: ATP-binding protein, partial [Rubrivivax sp.]